MKTIAIWNNKGGTVKTSLCFHLAQMCALVGKTTLIIDNDPQNTLSSVYLGIKESAPGVAQILRGEEEYFDCIIEHDSIKIDNESSLAAIPAHASYSDIFDMTKSAEFNSEKFGEMINDPAIQSTFDYCFIDNNPMWEGPSKISVKYADEVFIPCIPSKPDVEAISRTISNIEKYGATIGEDYGKKITRIIPTKVRLGSNIAKIQLRMMKAQYPKLVTKNYTLDTSLVEKSAMQGKNIFVSEGSSNYSKNMISLIEELFPEDLNMVHIREQINKVKAERRISSLKNWLQNKKDAEILEVINENTVMEAKVGED